MSVDEALLTWFARHGRDLPWRSAHRSPYRVVVSEFMLQQTQVDRVVPIFNAFVARFPSFAALAQAAPADVVRMWKGLGYNSRALRLHALAVAVTERFGGELPRDREALLALPGIGPYTASAILAFAFDADVLAVDTNVARVTARIYGERTEPSTHVPAGRGHDWNSALMDLGASLCTARAARCLVCPLLGACASGPLDPETLARAKPPRRQSPQEKLPFEQTTRFLRGRLLDRLRELAPGEAITADAIFDEIAVATDRSRDDIASALAALEREGFIARAGSGIALR